MLTYDFENVKIPLYEYIYKCIKSDILSGVLKTDEKLPSKRTFAKNNGISTITIQNAYDQLIAEGYVYTLPKRGYFVADINSFNILPKASNITLDIDMPKENKAEIDLSGNNMNPDNFPFSIWSRITRQVIASKKDELMKASLTTGVLELRKAIAEHLKSFRGMLIDPNQIVVGAGTEYLYGLLIQILGNDKRYAIENPGYNKLHKIYNQYGVKSVLVDIDEKGVSADGLRNTATDIAHICPNHHFPTGVTMPADRRYEILSWANEKENRYIIEDDYDSEFRVSGKPIPTLFSIDACEKVIYMNTFSKSLTPTIRVSYMILPVHLVNLLFRNLSFYSCTVSTFEQYTLAEFINKGYFEKHINRMRLYYSRQRRKVIDIIKNSKLSKKSEIVENDSGLHFILKVDTKVHDKEIERRLLEKGILIKALSDYDLLENKKNEHYFVFNYSNIDLEKLYFTCDEIYKSL